MTETTETTRIEFDDPDRARWHRAQMRRLLYRVDLPVSPSPTNAREVQNVARKTEWQRQHAGIRTRLAFVVVCVGLLALSCAGWLLRVQLP